jgi:hypothetical protein
MGLDRAAVYVSDLTSHDVSSEYIRRMETEAKPVSEWDPIIILAMAHIYHRRVKELPPQLAERVKKMRRLLDHAPRETAQLVG